MRTTTIQISNKSTLLAEQRFYDNTFLTGTDGSVVLFVCDAAYVRGPSGRKQLRTKRDAIEFDNESVMLAELQDGGWVEAPLEDDRQWKPTAAALTPGGTE